MVGLRQGEFDLEDRDIIAAAVLLVILALLELLRDDRNAGISRTPAKSSVEDLFHALPLQSPLSGPHSEDRSVRIDVFAPVKLTHINEAGANEHPGDPRRSAGRDGLRPRRKTGAVKRPPAAGRRQAPRHHQDRAQDRS